MGFLLVQFDYTIKRKLIFIKALDLLYQIIDILVKSLLVGKFLGYINLSSSLVLC